MTVNKTLNEISKLINTRLISTNELNEILAKALELNGLPLEDCAKLINVEDKELWESIFKSSYKVKEAIFGSRIAIFAPLYITNVCRNDCLYCAFRRSNVDLQRKTLTDEEIRNEVKVLEEMGHKRICLVYGDNPRFRINDFVKHIKTCFETKSDGKKLYEVWINLEPPSKEEFAELAKSNLRVNYRAFQETYHLPTYNTIHKNGLKANYNWRIEVFDRAIKGGITNIGLGVLFGLYDYRFEVLSLIAHSYYLLTRYGVRINSVSIPRLRPSLNTPFSKSPPFPIGEEELRKIIAILRLSIPWTEIIITTRETSQFRIESCKIGISEMSAGSSTSPGGYSQTENKVWAKKTEQFELLDHSTFKDVIISLCYNGYIPSFWSLCSSNGYETTLLKNFPKKNSKDFYLAEALLTFYKYLLGNGFPSYNYTQIKALIDNSLKDVVSDNLRRKLKIRLSNHRYNASNNN